MDLLLRKSALKNLAVEVDPDRARLTHRVILNLKKSVYIYIYVYVYIHTHTLGLGVLDSPSCSHRYDYLDINGIKASL